MFKNEQNSGFYLKVIENQVSNEIPNLQGTISI